MDAIDVKILPLYRRGRSQRAIGKSGGLSQPAIHKRLRRLRREGLVDRPDRPAITRATPPDNPQAGSTAGNQTLSERTVIVRAAAPLSPDPERLSELAGKISEYLDNLWPEAILQGERMADALRRGSTRKVITTSEER